jgi:hypothetical protein
MEVSLCITICCSASTVLAQRRFYGMSRNLNCTILVLLLAVKNGVQKDMLCLGVLFNPQQNELKFFRFPRDPSGYVCFPSLRVA